MFGIGFPIFMRKELSVRARTDVYYIGYVCGKNEAEIRSEGEEK